MPIKSRKYTKSKDGILRTNIQVMIRLTSKEVTYLEQFAKYKNKSLNELFWYHASNIADYILESEEYNDWLADKEK